MSAPDLTTLSSNEIKEFVADNLPPEVKGEPKEATKRVCVALLAYDGRIFLRSAMCIIRAVVEAAQKGWGFTYIIREGDSMVARGRSFLASQFLENPGTKHCTDLVMIDTDLEWHRDEFTRICEHPVDVVGGAYPYKDESGDFPLRWPAEGLFEENGLWSVDAVTPGFFRVTRKALEKMSRQLPWLEFKDRGAPEGQRNWMFFDNLHRPTGIYDEGYVFCERWRTLGGKVWLDPELNITHIGLKAYNHGTIGTWLTKKAETFEKLEAEYPGVPPLVLMSKAMGQKVDLDAEVAKIRASDNPSSGLSR